MRILDFYTTWATILHILHLGGKIKSTKLIAYFVFLIGTFVTITNEIPYPTVIFVHIVHILPLILIKDNTLNFDIFFLSLLLYFLHCGLSTKKIRCIYSEMYKYRTGKKHCN